MLNKTHTSQQRKEEKHKTMTAKPPDNQNQLAIILTLLFACFDNYCAK